MPTRGLITALLLIAAGAGCSGSRGPSAEVYREAVTAFYVGVSAMQTTQEVLARQKLDRVVALVPEEPAGWADRGLLLLRQRNLDQGTQDLARAASLAPDNADIQKLQALAESQRGNLADATRHWRRALELDPADPEAAYALALETERQGDPDNEAEAQRLLAGLVARSGNLAARLEYARVAAKRGDQKALNDAIAPLTGVSRAWSPEAQSQLENVMKVAAGDPRSTSAPVTFLKNVLLREPVYRAALAELSTPRSEIGRPLMRFVRLKNPDPEPAPADTAITFAVDPIANAQGVVTWAGPIFMSGEGNPVVATVDGAGIHLPAGAAPATCRGWTAAVGNAPVTAHAVAAADLNYDFRTDLAIAGPGGLCLLRQDASGRFTDVNAESKLPAALIGTPASGVWAADIDADGDLDLVLATRDGHPVVLRNNADGTFTSRDLFGSVTRARGFVWADLDGEGVPDAAFLEESGAVHVFLNGRGGIFREETLPKGDGQAVAIAPLEDTSASIFDLIVLARDGAITRVARDPDDRTWKQAPLSRVDPPAGLEPGSARLLTADLDNNGAADVIVSGPAATRVLLGGPGGAFTAIRASLPLAVEGVADLDGDGKLEAVGLGQGAQPSRAVSKATKSYRWQVIRPRAATATGDQRINSFGIGGEIEVRSGLHLQRRIIASPAVHFGLGEAGGAEVVRLLWPNGILQAEFDTKADQAVAATQRLKGSCPWLFAWNGREMSFVTDLLWRSPLGLRINAQTTADVLMTEDWVKVRGDQLAPQNGLYDLRVTAELWETHFFDLVSLLVVDHPADTDVFVDERFAVPPPKLQVVATGHVQPFASVRDDGGHDVTQLASSRDSRHVDVGRGDYQGITRRHFVEMNLPESAPRTGRLWLVAQGWIHPTDSSINVAIAQGAHAAPEGLSLHVADAAGRFHEVRKGLGFPSGKDKTILIDLTGLFGPTAPRRLRLATNLEIFWDRLGWAVARPDVRIQPRRLDLQSAELAFRGYSVTEQSSPSSPERPRYMLAGTAPLWRDLEGYYTRFGDVRELLTRVDDRYVIMNAGDELRVTFPEAPPPAPGLVRDFVAVADGWEKDGDYNTTFSRTVLPLPTHGSGRYDTAALRLEADPVYREHPDDFARYHTRYVTSDSVRDALRVAPGAASSTRRP
jgi:Tfp pilus assembly protein PilF